MAPDCSLNTTGLAITTAQEFFVTYFITFTFLLLCLVPFQVHLVTGCNNLRKLDYFNIFTTVFVKIFCIWNIITGLYWVAHQCRHSPAPVPKLKRDKRKLNYKPTQIAPLIDEYTTGIWTRPTLVLNDDSPLLTPKEVFQPTKQHYERFNLYINFQTKSGHLTDPVGEAIDLFEHTLDKTALVWFQTNRSKFKDLTTLKTMCLQRYNPWGKTKREQL